jgi:hypothetical protein
MQRARKKIVLLLFATMVIYALWNARSLIAGPQIDILSPGDGGLILEQTIKVEGVAKNVSFITLNGRQIFTDKEGLFDEEILPHRGYNIIEINAEDRFGKNISRQIKFYYNKE